MRLSRRVQMLKPSSTLAVTAKAKAMRAEGIDVISFAAGEPDFETPAPIREAAARALAEGDTRYKPSAGTPEARRAIADKLMRENGVEGISFENVVISAGGKHSLYLLFEALLDGDSEGAPLEVLLPTPSWVSYAPQIELAGARVVELPTTAETGFRITPEQLDAAITPRSRILMLNSPSNPCGTMYTPDDLRALAAVVARTARDRAPDLMIFSDELYEKIVFGDTPHLTIQSIPEVSDRTVTIGGLSKAYAMTGWRLGYCATPATGFGLELARAVAKLQTQMNTHVTSFCMPAIPVALNECAAEVEQMRQAFARRAQIAYDALVSLPGVVCPKPQGAFYAFPDVSTHLEKRTPDGRLLVASRDFAEALLDTHRVAVVPGEDFLGIGHQCVRISFACADDELREGLGRLGAFLHSLR